MRRTLPPGLGVMIGYVLVTCAFTWPLLINLPTHFTGAPDGDTGVYVWNQWVFHKELIAGHNPFSTDKILVLSTPAVDLTQHNYTAFLNILALPLISPVGINAAFNLVFLALCFLNAIVTYGLVRRVTPANRWEAWLAGLVFAWSPAMVARTTGHFSLVAAAALPAFVWCLFNAEESRRPRDAALVGLCMAWAALSDAYYGVYCLMIAVLYVGMSLLRIARGPVHAVRPWKWLLDVLIVCVAGLIAGLVFGRGGEFMLLGVPIRIRSLYTPVLAATVLVLARVALSRRPYFELPARRAIPIKLSLIAALACAAAMSPVLYGLGERIVNGDFVSPQIFWRSSPRGVDLLSFVAPNPQHPLTRLFMPDQQALAPTVFVEYTASLSLVALGVIAIAAWQTGYRPRKVWTAIAIAFALLALGPFVIVGGVNTHIPGPWALLRYAPGFGLARMPSRFSIVALLGVAVLLAGALAAIGAKWPQRRRAVGALVGVLLIVELWPAPRPLYSAAISPIFDRIAEDPRPIRVLVLPFGVRDGVWETGNFRPRTQYEQTRHGKALMGGYLSRISEARVDRMRQEYPALEALIKLSEKAPFGPEVKATLDDGGYGVMQQGNVGYVVIDSRFIPAERAQLAIDAFRLREVQRDAHLTLYVPERAQPER